MEKRANDLETGAAPKTVEPLVVIGPTAGPEDRTIAGRPDADEAGIIVVAGILWCPVSREAAHHLEDDPDYGEGGYIEEAGSTGWVDFW